MGFPKQQQQVPGVQSPMNPVPDCGENSYRGSGRLTGKRAVITGGDSGIGRAVAIAYGREGADVLIVYLNEDEDAAEVAAMRGRISTSATTSSATRCWIRRTSAASCQLLDFTARPHSFHRVEQVQFDRPAMRVVIHATQRRPRRDDGGEGGRAIRIRASRP
jgi:NAD(P)-dependent dehydrogenase (short-subunit alcohol dehydrogenase family)